MNQRNDGGLKERKKQWEWNERNNGTKWNERNNGRNGTKETMEMERNETKKQ